MNQTNKNKTQQTSQNSNIDIKHQHQQEDLTKIKENNLIYDKHGIINTNILNSYSLKIFVLSFIIYTQMTLYILWKLKYQMEVIGLDTYIHLMTQYFTSSLKQYQDNFISTEFILIHSTSLSFTLLTIALFNLYIYKKAKIQKRLSSVGLSNYYLKSNKNSTYIFKLRLGEVMEYDKFLKSFENIKQTFSKSNVKFERHNETEIKVTFIENFPTINDLKGLSPKDYLLPNKIFIGFGINTNPKSKEKFEPKYLDMDDIPVGVANLGSAGGGKSNTANQYLYSIFFNFNRVQKFYFIDFKGGIEAEPINDLEKKHKTNKIEVLDDNRLRLYEILKQLNLINKSRMLYLKTNKLKKFVDNYIYIIFDELAEILDYEPKEKNEKQMQSEISAIIESLLRTGRSQGFKIFYSTQSFLSTSSGLTSGMKNNTKLRVLHQTKNKTAIGSVIPLEELEEEGFDPYSYDMGRNLVITDEEMLEVRSLYIQENFLEEIVINNSFNEKLESDMKSFYKTKLDEMIADRDKMNTDKKEEIYSLENIGKDLGIEIKTDTKLADNITKKSEQKTLHKKPNPNSQKISLNESKNHIANDKEIKSFLSKYKQNPKQKPISDKDIEIDTESESKKIYLSIKENNLNIDIEEELKFLEEEI
jgi:hypothetical protein